MSMKAQAVISAIGLKNRQVLTHLPRLESPSMEQLELGDFEPVEQPDEWVCPSCGEDSYGSYRAVVSHYDYCAEYDMHFLHDYFGHRLAREYGRGVSVTALSDKLGVDKKTVSVALQDSLGIELRGKSESAKMAHKRAGEKKRERMLYGGQDKAARTLSNWRERNPDKHRQNARENLPDDLGNGSEHPCWRGGANLRNALTHSYGNLSWNEVRSQNKQRDGYECQLCGDTGAKLHTHHVVPVLAGGTNHEDNLITLCCDCHPRVESYTWDLFGICPVFDHGNKFTS